MRKLIAPTEDFIKGERDELTADVSAGSGVTINLLSSGNFAVGEWIVIGQEGSETAELVQIASVPNATSITATTVLAHKKGEPIVKYRYNKRKFYGSLTSGGSYTELTSSGSPVAIRVNNPQGTLLEYTGVEGYIYFKSTYYRSDNLDETAIADATETYSDESLRYCSLYEIRVQAGLTENPYIDDGRIEKKRIQAENEINSVLFRIYTLPLTEVPGLIKRICELLAAGYIDFEEYGPDGQGVKWLGEARGLLKAIRDGLQHLVGADGTELPRNSLTQGIQSYPDRVDDNNGPAQFFKMGQKF